MQKQKKERKKKKKKNIKKKDRKVHSYLGGTINNDK